MIHPLFVSGGEASAWVAALAGAVAITLQAAQALRRRHREKEEIDDALDQQPMVRQQLELGNVGEAVKHLNVIINSQATHIKAQEIRLEACDTKIQELEDRNEALESEARTYRLQYEEIKQLMKEMEQRHNRRINELERGYARSLAMMRQKDREQK